MAAVVDPETLELKRELRPNGAATWTSGGCTKGLEFSPKNPFVCATWKGHLKSLSGWDWNPQSYSRNGFGFLGFVVSILNFEGPICL